MKLKQLDPLPSRATGQHPIRRIDPYPFGARGLSRTGHFKEDYRLTTFLKKTKDFIFANGPMKIKVGSCQGSTMQPLKTLKLLELT